MKKTFFPLSIFKISVGYRCSGGNQQRNVSDGVTVRKTKGPGAYASRPFLFCFLNQNQINMNNFRQYLKKEKTTIAIGVGEIREIELCTLNIYPEDDLEKSVTIRLSPKTFKKLKEIGVRDISA